jgi:hypothetical protein
LLFLFLLLLEFLDNVVGLEGVTITFMESTGLALPCWRLSPEL